jgi:hypothetical protein
MGCMELRMNTKYHTVRDFIKEKKRTNGEDCFLDTSISFMFGEFYDYTVSRLLADAMKSGVVETDLKKTNEKPEN